MITWHIKNYDALSKNEVYAIIQFRIGITTPLSLSSRQRAPKACREFVTYSHGLYHVSDCFRLCFTVKCIARL